jgi:ubiquinone/menaquinone biosynthesis C-methylase UbiE
MYTVRSDPHTYEEVRRVLIASAGEGARLLDVGCGSGAFLNSVRDIAPGFEGCDFNTDQYADGESRARIKKVNLNEEPLPYADGTFDAATCLDVLEHVLNPYQIARELLRVVRPGGHVIISTPNVASILQRTQFLVTGGFRGFFDAAHSRELGERHVSPIFRQTLEEAIEGAGSIVSEDFNRTVIPKLRIEIPQKHLLLSEAIIWTIQKDA